jgi:MFS family permease
MGVPYISLILITPVGGIMADRLKKQRIMFWLDAITTVIILLYMFANGFSIAAVPLAIVKLLALNAIQGMYIPAVQAAVPALVPSEKLPAGNAATGIVNSLSGMAGMAIAGFLYARFGLFPILSASAVCFAVTAIMDLLIRIPYKKQPPAGSVTELVKRDLSQAARFTFIENPILAKISVVVFLVVILLAALLIVGLPILIIQYLNMNESMVGINQSIVMVGGIIGSIIAGALGERLTIRKIPLIVMLGSLPLIFMGLVFLLDVTPVTVYVIITATGALAVCTTQLFSVTAITYVQRVTSPELIGKVMSMLMMIPFIANAVGAVLFGVLFEWFAEYPWIIIFAAAFLSIAVALFSRKSFTEIHIPQQE